LCTAAHLQALHRRLEELQVPQGGRLRAAAVRERRGQGLQLLLHRVHLAGRGVHHGDHTAWGALEGRGRAALGRAGARAHRSIAGLQDTGGCSGCKQSQGDACLSMPHAACGGRRRAAGGGAQRETARPSHISIALRRVSDHFSDLLCASIAGSQQRGAGRGKKMGACSPCNILFHVLSLLQAGGVEGAREPGGGLCTNFERDLPAAPLGGLRQLAYCTNSCGCLRAPIAATLRSSACSTAPHATSVCLTHPPPLQPLSPFRAQVALAITICIIIGVKLQDVSYDSGTFNYSCLLGTDYGSSSLCTVSERHHQCTSCSHSQCSCLGRQRLTVVSLLPGTLQYTYAVAGISLAVSALVSLIQVGTGACRERRAASCASYLSCN